MFAVSFGWLDAWFFLGEGKVSDVLYMRPVRGLKGGPVVFNGGEWGFDDVVAGTRPGGI